MAETPYNHYALYEPDASPDLTATGEYNSAIMDIDADIHAERIDRETADNRLQAALADESQERKDADDRLDERIDNAEGEISANSADLTGIKSLTYGSEHVQFLEHDNGSYSSPALDEIAHEISDSTLKVFTTTATGSVTDTHLTFDVVKDSFEHSVVVSSDMYLWPLWTNHADTALYVASREKSSGHRYVRICQNGATLGEALPRWTEIVNKPFSTIGSGLKVESDALTLSVASDNTLGCVKIPSDDNYPLGVNDNGELYLSQFIPYRIQIQHTSHECADLNLETGALIFKGPAFSVEATGDYGSVAVGLNLPDSGITADTQWGTIEA